MASSRYAAHLEGSAQLERTAFFSDAVFAIAMTLLVIDLRVPDLPRVGDRELAQALLDLLPNYIGFIVSFVVIGRFWVAHHELFGLLKASDGRLMRRNLVLLLAVAFMPFPTAVLSHYSGLRVGVCLYSAWLGMLGVANVAVTYAAFGQARLLVSDEVGDDALRARRRGAWEPVLVGTLAFAAGLALPVAGLATLMLAAPVIGFGFRRWTGPR